MAARISENGEVEIEFYIGRTEEGHVSIWYEKPPPDLARNLEVTGPFTATAMAMVSKRLAPH